MRGLRALASSFLAVGIVASTVGVANADIVSTPAGNVATVQLSLTMDNDWQFANSECLFIPVLATYGRADDTSILGELTVSKVGSPDTSNEGTFLVLPGDPVSGQVIDEIFVCPADGTGEYRLDATIRAIEPDAETSFALDPLTFWVRPAVSTMLGVQATATKGGTSVTGKVQAGSDPATGVVSVRYREPGVRRWVQAPVALVEDGKFRAQVDKVLPPKTRIKATVRSCSWCTRASASTRIR